VVVVGGSGLSAAAEPLHECRNVSAAIYEPVIIGLAIACRLYAVTWVPETSVSKVKGTKGTRPRHVM
jgi:hypothetical protein